MKKILISVILSIAAIIGFSQNTPIFIHNKNGDELLNKSDTVGAITEYSKTIESNPDNYYALKKRGLLYYAKGKYKEAEKDFTNCIAIKQTDAMVFYHRGNARQKQAGDPSRISYKWDGVSSVATPDYSLSEIWKSSLNDYLKALELDPNLHVAYDQYSKMIRFQSKFQLNNMYN